MPDIHYVRKHDWSLSDAKKRVQQAADELEQEYDVRSEWSGNTLHFSRSGVEGTMAVTAQDVTLDVTLGFLLKPFKAKFEAHIERNLDRALAAAPASEKPGKTTTAGTAGAAAAKRKDKA